MGEDILDDYSVILSYSGSRFYGTIAEPDKTFYDLFPPDYHAFWSKSFDVNRTFIISDTTASGTQLGSTSLKCGEESTPCSTRTSSSPTAPLVPRVSRGSAFLQTIFHHCSSRLCSVR